MNNVSQSVYIYIYIYIYIDAFGQELEKLERVFKSV